MTGLRNVVAGFVMAVSLCVGCGPVDAQQEEQELGSVQAAATYISNRSCTSDSDCSFGPNNGCNGGGSAAMHCVSGKCETGCNKNDRAVFCCYNSAYSDYVCVGAHYLCTSSLDCASNQYCQDGACLPTQSLSNCQRLY